MFIEGWKEREREKSKGSTFRSLFGDDKKRKGIKDDVFESVHLLDAGKDHRVFVGGICSHQLKSHLCIFHFLSHVSFPLLSSLRNAKEEKKRKEKRGEERKREKDQTRVWKFPNHGLVDGDDGNFDVFVAFRFADDDHIVKEEKISFSDMTRRIVTFEWCFCDVFATRRPLYLILFSLPDKTVLNIDHLLNRL